MYPNNTVERIEIQWGINKVTFNDIEEDNLPLSKPIPKSRDRAFSISASILFLCMGDAGVH
jgi:hypothetical protein